jgi:ribonuclease-3
MDGRPLGQGTGRSKKEAEQQAAAVALELLKSSELGE